MSTNKSIIQILLQTVLAFMNVYYIFSDCDSFWVTNRKTMSNIVGRHGLSLTIV